MDQSKLPSPTKRLFFRSWHSDDAPWAHAIWGDAVVTELTGGPFTPRAVEQRLAQEIENWQRCHIQYWPLFRLCDDTLIGCCGLRPRKMETRVAELGFQLCRGSWGQGFASEASTAVIEWARANGFTALISGHHPENLASRRVLLRLGFAYTHDELYPPTGFMEPCYCLQL